MVSLQRGFVVVIIGFLANFYKQTETDNNSGLNNKSRS